MGLKPAEISQASKLLEQYSAASDKMVTDLSKKQDEINEKIKTAFKEMQHVPYYLHAILVHDGWAESGHYYAFILDRANKTWIRFNDYQVSFESEQQVFQESLGGHLNSSAYSLIYVNQEVESALQKQLQAVV